MDMRRLPKSDIKNEDLAVGSKRSDLRDVLFDKSREYFSLLKSPNGRFSHLDITDIILPGIHMDIMDIDVDLSNQEDIPLIKTLDLLWGMEVWHSVIVGEGGMGKTVSLIRLWEKCIKSSEEDTPIPIYIALNEYNEVDVKDSRHFIINTIMKDYFSKLDVTNQACDNLWELMKAPINNGKTHRPSVILLLDGFNEISRDKSELLNELNNIIEKARGTQIIITSRFDMRDTLKNPNINIIKLKELSREQISRQCQKYLHIAEPSGKLLETVKNPMMLTIYLSTCSIVERNRDNRYYEFLYDIQSQGEMLWNYIESMTYKHSENISKGYYYRFVLKHLLPYLGWRMEQEGKYFITHREFITAVNDACKYFNSNSFYDTFTFFIDYSDRLNLEKLDENGERARFAKLRKVLTEELVMIVAERETYRFLHQNFRDYFAAVHILNEIRTCLLGNQLLKDLVIKNMPISHYVGRYMGEIEGEHKNVPIKDPTNQCYTIEHYKDTLLTRLPDKCREIYDRSMGHTVWNILEIWKNVRGELTGADLSCLDLSDVLLNTVRCSRTYADKTLAVNFDGSIIDEINILPQGHSDHVNYAVYSPDGSRILSASDDNTIKEWDARTGKHIRTYIGHSMSVNTAVYNPAGNCILSASSDGSIKEWDILTGSCIRAYGKNTDKVSSATYNHDGSRIIAAISEDIIREWDVWSGECIRTYGKKPQSSISDSFRIVKDIQENTIRERNIQQSWERIWAYNEMLSSFFVSKQTYNPDGSRIIAASWENTIKEWNVQSGEYIRTCYEHSENVWNVIYSPDGSHIAASASDNSIREWDVQTGKCIMIYRGHYKFIRRVVYSRDGNRILSASTDGTAKEWDVRTGKCIRTFEGHSGSVNSAVYSPDGNCILTASDDKSIKIWDKWTGKCIKTIGENTRDVSSVAYSPDGSRILAVSGNGTVKEWDARTGKYIRTYGEQTDNIYLAVYHPDGSRILTVSSDDTLKEWDVRIGECIRTYEKILYLGARSVVYNSDGSGILVGSMYKPITVHDLLSGDYTDFYEDELLDEPVISAVYSPDETRILICSEDGTIKEWDVRTKECIRPYKGHTKYVNSAVYSPDGRCILSSSADGTIREWDVQKGGCIKVFKGHKAAVCSAAYSNDGKHILSVSQHGTIKKWDRQTGKCINTYENNRSHVYCVTYSPDLRYILIAYENGVIKEWDMQTGKCNRDYYNVDGLILEGCSMRNLHKDSNLTYRAKKILKSYGVREVNINRMEECKSRSENMERDNNIISNKRFSVALSFPGEYRRYVKKVDAELIKLFLPEKVFFDERYEPEIIGLDSDKVLQEIYHDKSDMVVVFLCKEYKEKEWCNNVECRAIRDRIKKGQGKYILPLRFDFTDIEGFFSIDISPDISKRDPKDVAELIYKRYKVIMN